MNYNGSLDCIEHLLNMSLITRHHETITDPYALLAIADYEQSKTKNFTRAAQLYVDLFRNGDPRVSTSYYSIEFHENKHKTTTKK
jgi:hypothetical protein